MNETWRNQYNDSDGNAVTFSWDYIMEEIYCESNQGCSAVIETMQNEWEDNISYFGDGEGWHYHSREWYNFSEWDANEDGWMSMTDTGNCEAGGCQTDVKYWNQVVVLNDDYAFRDETSKGLAEKMLAVFLIDSEFYPVAYVSGWLWENNDFSNWIDDYVPVSFNNWWVQNSTSSDNSAPYSGVQSWKNTPLQAYNPSPTDYKAIGNNTRIQFPVDAGHSYKLMNYSFWLANQGLDVIYAHYSHSYSSIKTDVENTHQCLNDTIWGTCDEGTDMGELYPNVTYYYDDDVGMLQQFFELDDTTAPNITLWTDEDNNWAYFNSTETMWNIPVLAIENETNYYMEIGVENGTNQWKVDISNYNPMKLRAAGIDEAYNPAASELVFKGRLNITYPTTENYYNITYPTNITINFTVENRTDFLTSGVQFINATIGGIEASNTTAISYFGGNIWQINVSVPELTGYQDLYLKVNHSDTDELTHTESNSIYYYSPDTCTCPGAGNNWEVNMEDNCNLTTACTLTTGNLTWIGSSGYFNCSAQLNLTNRNAPPSGTIFYHSSGCEIIYLIILFFTSATIFKRKRIFKRIW